MLKIARLLTLLIVAIISQARAAEPALSTLFTAGEGGYFVYRIPGVIVSNRGTLLAWCEARKHNASDWGHIDIQMRRSTDGGNTWSAPQTINRGIGPNVKNPAAIAKKVSRPEDVTHHNGVMIADRDGAIHFVYNSECCRCFYCRSLDEGVSFTDPIELTSTFEKFRPEYEWQVFATGPGHCIQLRSGRLLVPVWLSKGTGNGAHRPSVVATIYSDDSGNTWHRGTIVAGETDPLTNPSESVAAELSNGRVMLNIRHESKNHRRAVSFSPDGATAWTRPIFDEELVEPICMASQIRIDDKLLFANPANLDRQAGPAKAGQGRDRKNLTLRLSYDDGKTWPVKKTLDSGPSAYSDLAVLPDGTICCLYERNQPTATTLTLARFKLEWLTDGKTGDP